MYDDNLFNLNAPLTSNAYVKNERFTSVNMAFKQRIGGNVSSVKIAIQGSRTIQIFVFIVFKKLKRGKVCKRIAHLLLDGKVKSTKINEV